VSGYEKIIPMNFNRHSKMQCELLLLLGIVCSLLGFHISQGEKIRTAGGKRGEHPRCRMELGST